MVFLRRICSSRPGDGEQRGQSLAALTARGRGLDCFQPQPRLPVLRRNKLRIFRFRASTKAQPLRFFLLSPRSRLIVNTSAPLFSHIFPLLSAVCRLCTGRRTIGLPSIRSHGSAAYRASLEIRPWPFCQQRSLQRRIKGQNCLAEVAAISPRPAFPKHIALAIQRQAAAVPVIVGTPF